MNFENLQKAWQTQDAGAQANINTDRLLEEVRRKQQQFRATIFWRDVREVGVAFLLTLYFMQHGLRHDDWTDCLAGLACFGVGAFMVVDRMRQRRKEPTTNDPLKAWIESSLNKVSHQIWLLKNVFWWYLLPIAAALAISIGHSTWHARNAGLPVATVWIFCAVVIGGLYWGIYRLNQFAVSKELEPRRQELEALLASLK